jgi:Iron-sulfur cluster-binding domain
VDTLLSLGPMARVEATHSIDAAVRRLEAHGLSYEFTGDFFETFKRHNAAPPATVPPEARPNRIFSTVGSGSTRDCFDPWNYVQIKATGDVYPCCAHSPIGRVDGQHTLTDVLDGPELAALRERLLNGDLDAECRHCHQRSHISQAEFQARYLNTFGVSVSDAGVITRPPWLTTPATEATVTGLRRRLHSILRRWRARAFTSGIVFRVDSPVGGPVRRRIIQVRGWCFSVNGQPVSGRILIDGVCAGELTPQVPRPDVTRHLADPSIPLTCGFLVVLRLPESTLDGQAIELVVELQTAGGKPVRSRTIVLRLKAEAVAADAGETVLR